ncbi:uncharacterized protein [Dysidea avara]|uniref:uncharacterized protein n=1 Tax=Dysidea avara TaxID=196820 RepID=UPI00332AC732
MAKIFPRPYTSNCAPGKMSGLNYTVSDKLGKELPPYIIPTSWDGKSNKTWRPSTPFYPPPATYLQMDRYFNLYHPGGMLPHYTGYIPSHRFKIGITYGRSTKEYGWLHYSKMESLRRHANSAPH